MLSKKRTSKEIWIDWTKRIFSFLFLIIISCQDKPVGIEQQKSSPSVKNESNFVHVPITNDVDYDTSVWTEIIQGPTISLDLKYASADNFIGEPIYDCARCFLKKPVALHLKKAAAFAYSKGYRIRLYDCYRPLPYQQKLWDKMPNINYVAPPSKGSQHNKGITIDLTLESQDGNILPMGTDFDEFSEYSHTIHPGLDSSFVKNRQLLKDILSPYGFKGIRTEWWHYTYLPSLNQPLENWVWKCN